MLAPLIRKNEPTVAPVCGGPRRTCAGGADKKNDLQRKLPIEAGSDPVGQTSSDFSRVPLSERSHALAGPGGRRLLHGLAQEVRQPASAAQPGDPAAAPTTPASVSAAPEASSEFCTITSKTRMAARDAPDERTKVGVSEKVEFSIGEAADWSAASGTPAASPGLEAFLWTAPETAGSVTIEATHPTFGFSCTSTMEVILPTHIEMKSITEDSFGAGVPGAGMWCDVFFFPYDVSFANSEWTELSGPPSNVEGYFERLQKEMKKAGTDMDHHAEEGYKAIHVGNAAGDHAWAGPLPRLDADGQPPWGPPGGFEWVIPTKIRRLSGSSDGVLFTNTTQIMCIDENATVSLSKAGETVTRSP